MKSQEGEEFNFKLYYLENGKISMEELVGKVTKKSKIWSVYANISSKISQSEIYHGPTYIPFTDRFFYFRLLMKYCRVYVWGFYFLWGRLGGDYRTAVRTAVGVTTGES